MRRSAPSLLFLWVAALLAGFVAANSVTSPERLYATTLAVQQRAASPTTTQPAILTPPSSPELRAAVSTADPDLRAHAPATTPEPTKPFPEFLDGDFDTDAFPGYRQTTYYSCVTRRTYTHCGWHIPILSAAAGPGLAAQAGDVAVRAGLVAAGVAGLMAVG
jgi:hypothetical protein